MSERLSARFDGDLEDPAADHVLDALSGNDEARHTWLAYCLIGDTLRSEPAIERDLVAGVMGRLADEPTVLAPVARVSPKKGFGRMLLPIAASVLGAAVVGLVSQTLNHSEASLPVADASRSAVAALPAASQPAVTTARGDPYMQYVFAHQSVAGGSPMPGVAQYVRTVLEARQGADR
jgi:sigma-E factor negative regulatory protein RseA